MSYFPTITSLQISDSTAAGRALLSLETPAATAFVTIDDGDSSAALVAVDAANVMSGGNGSITETQTPVTSVTFVNGIATAAS